MKFVYCVANVRALAFSISTSTEFEIESIAGNIIPTIVTTNSIVAGLMINEIMKYLHYRETDNYDKKLRNSFLNSNSSSGKYFVSNYIPVKNANCLICSGKRAISIQFDFSFSLSQNIITFLRTCEKFRSFEIVAENGSIIVEYGDESNFDELYLPPDLQKILLFAADYDSGKKIEIIAFNK
ncbi:MAG: E1 ubiquitin-activating protein uba2, variant 2 [Marteilia pararefringens]